MPTVSPHISSYAFSLNHIPLSIVAAKVRDMQRQRVGSWKRRVDRGLNKSLCCQDVLVPRFVRLGLERKRKAGLHGGQGSAEVAVRG